VEPYPYSIKAVGDIGHKGQKSSSWNWLEFMRIEALLRSPIVHAMYMTRDVSEPELFRRYALSWDVLSGEHHVLLEHPDKRVADVEERILFWEDRNRWNQEGISRIDMSAISDASDVDEDFYVSADVDYLCIDLTRSNKALMRAFESWLQSQVRPKVKYGLMTNGKSEFMNGRLIVSQYKRPMHMEKPSPIRQLPVWLNSLRIYDMRQRGKEKSFGEIAFIISGSRSPQARDAAQKGFDRVKWLIARAESNEWPPLRPSSKP
jgi:hypothetical protein